jgi:hypothetical protein
MQARRMDTTSMRKAANLRDITLLLHSLEQQMEQRYASMLFMSRAGILKHFMGAGNRAGIGLSYWSARLHRLAE